WSIRVSDNQSYSRAMLMIGALSGRDGMSSLKRFRLSFVAILAGFVGILVFMGAGVEAQAQVLAQAQTQAPAAGATPGAKSFLPPRGGAQASQPTGMIGGLYLWIAQKQAEINRTLAGAIKSLKDGGGARAAWIIAAFSFLYGVLHAAGPGHGKAVISSYILADGQTMRRGVALAFMAAFVQALAALALVTVLVLVMKSTQAEIKTTEAWLERASWGFVALFGAWLLWRQLKPLLSARAATQGHNHHAHDHGHAHSHTSHSHDHGHVHGPDCGPDCGHDHAHEHKHGHAHTAHAPQQHFHAKTADAQQSHSTSAADACEVCGHAHMPAPDELKKDWSWRRALTLAFAIGMRPCTGAILVLVFAISQGLMWAGVFATFAMALGTAITVSALAALAVGSRDLATRLAGGAGGSGPWVGRVQTAVGIAGAAAVMFLGASFFYYAMTTNTVF
ncbi:MAG: nickel/cobalt transporter, partial [Hyphomicrobiaceae bacterium]